MEGPSLCAALPLPRTPLLCPEVLRHIRGDGQGMRLGALPKTIEERNRDTWMTLLYLYFYVLYLFTIDP